MRTSLLRLTACSTIVGLMTGCGAARSTLSRYLPQRSTEASEQIALAANHASEVATPSESSSTQFQFDKDGDSIRPVAYNVAVPPLPPLAETNGESSNEIVAPVAAPTDMITASGWSLANLESLALQNNPAIKEVSAAAQKAMGFQTQVGTRPNPIVGYNATQLADQGTDQHVVFVEQEIVMGGKLRLNQGVLGQEVQSQLWEAEAQRYRVLTDVRQHYFDALAAQRKYELANAFHEIASKGADYSQRRLDAKEGTMSEVLQAEIQTSQVEIQRQQAEAAYRGAWRQLMAVVGMPQTTPGVLEGTLPTVAESLDWELIKSETLASSPELQAARARVCRAQANISRQDAQAIPNLSLMVAAGHDRSTGSGLVNAQIGLPVPFFNKNEGNISAAHAELCRSTQEVHRIELAIRSRIAAAAASYETAAAAVNQYEREILPRAEKTLTLTDAAYRAGEFDFLKVLVVRRTFFDSNIEYVTAQANLAKAKVYVDGMVLSGALETGADTGADSGLRDQSLSGQ